MATLSPSAGLTKQLAGYLVDMVAIGLSSNDTGHFCDPTTRYVIAGAVLLTHYSAQSLESTDAG
jgi:hypothetical protein